VKLLQFGFDWMKAVLFGEGDIRPKNAGDASQEGQES
jgi:hypothetical protein